MKIAIDCQNLNTTTPAGPEEFLYRLIEDLARVDNKNNYFLLVKSKLPESVKSNGKFKIIAIRPFLSWTQAALPIYLWRLGPDVLFSSNHTAPLLYSLFANNLISFVHGVDYRYQNSNFIQKFTKPLFLKACINLARRIVVPSEFVKKQVCEFVPSVKQDKISVVYEGVTPINQQEISRDSTDSLLSKFHLRPNEYFLFVSTIQPRKNIENLLRGYKEFIKTIHQLQVPKLVICGKQGWGYENISKLVEELGIKEVVVFTGWLTQNEKNTLILNCRAYINPSIEEGFSLTNLEAASAGKACLLSSISTHHEIFGDSATYFLAEKPSGITEALVKFTSLSDAEKEVLKSKALEKSKDFTWQKTAEEILKIFTSFAP